MYLSNPMRVGFRAQKFKHIPGHSVRKKTRIWPSGQCNDNAVERLDLPDGIRLAMTLTTGSDGDDFHLITIL